MNRPVFMLALRVSWLGGPGDRRRAALASIAGFFVALVALGGASAVQFSARVTERASARSPIEVGADQAQFGRASLFDEAPDGAQIYLYWWQFKDDSARIPGIAGVPAAGSRFVSPALHERMETDRFLADRFDGADTIAAPGVGNPEELVAYQIVGDDLPLPEQVSFTATDGWTGESADVAPRSLAAVVLLVVVTSGAGLLVAVSTFDHRSLQRRLTVLRSLGASPGTRRLLVTSEALLSGAPGVIAASLLWVVVSPRLSSVPVVGRQVLAGDLGLDGFAVAVVGVCVLGLVVLATSARPHRGTSRAMDGAKESASILRLAPLVVGLGLAAWSTTVGGPRGAKLFVAGVLMVTAAVIWAMPLGLRVAGQVLAERSSLSSLLAGRRLSYSSVTAARSLLGVTAILVLLPVVGAWYQVVAHVDQANDTPNQVVELRGFGLDGFAADLDREADIAEILLYPDPTTGREVLVADCASIAPFLDEEACADGSFDPAAVSPSVLGVYAQFRGQSDPPPGEVSTGRLVLSRNWQQVEVALRSLVVNGTNPTAIVSTPARGQLFASPVVDWILAAAALMAALGASALTLVVVNQSARTATSRRGLGLLGAPPRQVGVIAGIEAALVVGVVAAGSLVIGAVAGWLFLRLEPAARFPVDVLAWLSLVAFAATMISAGAAARSATGPT